MEEKVILGIDPGTSIMGYGVIKVKNDKMEMLTMGIIHLSKYKDHMLKLKHIFSRCLQLIKDYKPDELAIEAPFFGKNVQSMLKLGRAQGTAIAAALTREIPIFEYAPRKIKQSITGNGAASKEQVAKMLVNILDLSTLPKYLDATDGLAAAVTHHYQNKGSVPGSDDKYNSWQSFISNNPDRVK